MRHCALCVGGTECTTDPPHPRPLGTRGPPARGGETAVTWKDQQRDLERLVNAQDGDATPVVPRVLQGELPEGHVERELLGIVLDGHPALRPLPAVFSGVDDARAAGEEDPTPPAPVLLVLPQLLGVGALHGHRVPFEPPDVRRPRQRLVTWSHRRDRGQNSLDSSPVVKTRGFCASPLSGGRAGTPHPPGDPWDRAVEIDIFLYNCLPKPDTLKDYGEGSSSFRQAWSVNPSPAT